MNEAIYEEKPELKSQPVFEFESFIQTEQEFLRFFNELK